MKKSAKPILLFGIFLIVISAGLILAYVSIKLECELLTKHKVQAEEKLASKKNWKLNLIAQNQFLTSEERITNIAENELGMIKNDNSQIQLFVSKQKIEEISNELKEKYEQ